MGPQRPGDLLDPRPRSVAMCPTRASSILQAGLHEQAAGRGEAGARRVRRPPLFPAENAEKIAKRRAAGLEIWPGHASCGGPPSGHFARLQGPGCARAFSGRRTFRHGALPETFSRRDLAHPRRRLRLGRAQRTRRCCSSCSALRARSGWQGVGRNGLTPCRRFRRVVTAVGDVGQAGSLPKPTKWKWEQAGSLPYAALIEVEPLARSRRGQLR